MDTMNETQSFPDWLYELLIEPEEHDSEHGRSCHFCGSTHGRYDEPLEHYIDCVWLIACTSAGVSTEGHLVYEPKMMEPCEKCGWYYDSPDDWRGRGLPRPEATDEMGEAHDRHRCEEHGITYEQYLVGPGGGVGGYPVFGFDGRLAWDMKWMHEEMWKSMRFNPAERGAIAYIKPPDLSDEAIRSPDA